MKFVHFFFQQTQFRINTCQSGKKSNLSHRPSSVWLQFANGDDFVKMDNNHLFNQVLIKKKNYIFSTFAFYFLRGIFGICFWNAPDFLQSFFFAC